MDNSKDKIVKSRKIINGISGFINKYFNIYLKDSTENNIINDINENNKIIVDKIYENNIHKITDDNIEKLLEHKNLYGELAQKLRNL
jgi:hypothetical protein